MQRAESEAAAAVPAVEPPRDEPVAEFTAPDPPPSASAADTLRAPAAAAEEVTNPGAGEPRIYASPPVARPQAPARATLGRNPVMAGLAIGLLLLPAVVVLSLWRGGSSATVPVPADEPAALHTPGAPAGNAPATIPSSAAVVPDAVVPPVRSTPAAGTTTAPPVPAPDPAPGGSAASVEPRAPSMPAPAPAAPPSTGSRPAATEGQLVVVTEPPGASVTVNGIGHGAAPATVRFLPLGEHRIRVTLAGYRSEERVVRLTGGAPSTTVRIAMRP